MAEQPQERITPFPPLGDPIIGTDTAGSAPGTTQPVDTGQNALPPSLPAGSGPFVSAGWGWLPPPQMGMGENEPFPTPVVPPGTGPTYNTPTFATGSGTSPTAASLFPSFTAAGPSPPIVLNATQAAGTGTQFPQDWIAPPPVIYTVGQGVPPSGLPTTPGVWPIVIGEWGLGAGPGGGGEEEIEEDGEDEIEPAAAPVRETLAEHLHLPGAANSKARATKPKGRRK